MKILVVNAGSSSHKLSLYDIKNEEVVEPLWMGHIDWDHSSKKDEAGQIFRLVESLWRAEGLLKGPQEIERIGHRVVHGGAHFQKPVLIDEAVKKEIQKLIPLAPLHNPANLAGIQQMESLFPAIPQVAVFDTAFHHTMPEIIKTYPVPLAWKDEQVIRYGFHGISHAYCAERGSILLGRSSETVKIITCHLGNGSSLCAIKDGQSVRTTMGMTPLEGLMMGTRSGSIDPGILFYLMREKGYTFQQLDAALNFNSGLKAIGGSSDMRVIEQGMGQRDPHSEMAFDMYADRLLALLGEMFFTLEGADALIFTGGIGENSFRLRERICGSLSFLGLEMNKEANSREKGDRFITVPHSKLQALVIQTKEEWMIARECFRMH